MTAKMLRELLKQVAGGRTSVDAAFPVLIKNLLPTGIGLKGFVLAAIFGAVVSSLASMLNSSSTIFAMDIYRKIKREPTQFELVTVGRICVVAFVFIAMLIAPRLDNPKFGGIFTFIQEFQGFISPGILSIFLFGVLVHRAPRACGTVGLIINPILYGNMEPELVNTMKPSNPKGFLSGLISAALIDGRIDKKEAALLLDVGDHLGISETETRAAMEAMTKMAKEEKVA